jgi:hypothetical protein
VPRVDAETSAEHRDPNGEPAMPPTSHDPQETRHHPDSQEAARNPNAQEAARNPNAPKALEDG